MKVGETFAAGQPATNLANFGSGQTSKASKTRFPRFAWVARPFHLPATGDGGVLHHTAMNPRRDPNRSGSDLASARSRSAAPLRQKCRDALTSCSNPRIRPGGPGTGPSGAVPATSASAVMALPSRLRPGGGVRTELMRPSVRKAAKTTPGGRTSDRRRRTLKRSKAQEGAGPERRQRRATDTRPYDGARPRSRRSRSSHPDRVGPSNGTGRGEAATGKNGTGATTAAMRNGCRQGISLRGVRILHRGEALSHPGLRPGVQHGNAENPRIGSGMQQARDSSSGGNRRGGEKPRGRNRTSKVEPSRPKGWQAAIPGVDAERACRWRGDRYISRRACRDV